MTRIERLIGLPPERQAQRLPRLRHRRFAGRQRLRPGPHRPRRQTVPHQPDAPGEAGIERPGGL